MTIFVLDISNHRNAFERKEDGMLESVAPEQERVFVYEAFELSGFPLLALLSRFLCVFSLLVWL